MKVRYVIDIDGKPHVFYNCPGCKYEHSFSPNVHKWNGDYDNPTVTPSLLLSNPQKHNTCHSFITNGQIHFCNDCWHELNGLRDIDLPEYSKTTRKITDLRIDDDDQQSYFLL